MVNKSEKSKNCRDIKIFLSFCELIRKILLDDLASFHSKPSSLLSDDENMKLGI